ncbi:MAG: glycoside hydrolase family 97 protein, partial [Chitinophagaceae bacterium]
MLKPVHTLCLFLLFFSLVTEAQELLSPNKKIRIVVKNDAKSAKDQVQFSIAYQQGNKLIEVLPLSPLGISRTDQAFVNNLDFVGTSKAVAIHDKYEMISGKKKDRENFANEQTYHYKNSNGALMNIIFRAYNDGVAFRYEFPEKSGLKINVTGENTTYKLPEGTTRWIQEFELSYEGFYPLSTTGKAKKIQHWGFPALYKVNNEQVFALISEADLSAQNVAASLKNSNELNNYTVAYPEPRDNFKQQGAMGTLPWKSQWHTFI